MRKEGKIKEVEQLISMEGGKGFLAFEEGSEIPANDIVSSDQIDDVLMMFDEMDIDVVDDLQGLKVEEEKALEKEEEEGDELEMETSVERPILFGCICVKWDPSRFSLEKERWRSQKGLKVVREKC